MWSGLVIMWCNHTSPKTQIEKMLWIHTLNSNSPPSRSSHLPRFTWRLRAVVSRSLSSSSLAQCAASEASLIVLFYLHTAHRRLLPLTGRQASLSTRCFSVFFVFDGWWGPYTSSMGQKSPWNINQPVKTTSLFWLCHNRQSCHGRNSKICVRNKYRITTNLQFI